MRLTCPNCNAQYEVDAAVIPDLGRDVQCSNCGQTWFQAGPLTPVPVREAPQPAIAPQTTATPPAPRPEEPVTEIVEKFDGWDDGEPAIAAAQPEDDLIESEMIEADQPADILPESMAPIEPSETFDAKDFKDRAAFNSEFDEDYEAAPPPELRAPRRAMDGDLLAVLREEAEREVQARKAEGSALETQPDLGLNDVKPEPRPIEREARLSGFDEMPDEDAPRATRRDLLPDIEEINSTLRATSDRSQGFDQDPALDRAKGTGFGRGFVAVIALAAIGLGTYIGAPKISAAVPAIAPALNGYVASIEGARLWLDATMTGLTQSMRDKSKS